jgi:hypothetical protein
LSLKVLCTLTNVSRCGTLRSGHRCWYSSTTALPFPLWKPYTKCMSAYSSFVNVLHIFSMTVLYHNIATLA